MCDRQSIHDKPLVVGVPLATHDAFRWLLATGVWQFLEKPEALLMHSVIETKKVLPCSVSSSMVTPIPHHGPVGCSAAFAWVGVTSPHLTQRVSTKSLLVALP